MDGLLRGLLAGQRLLPGPAGGAVGLVEQVAGINSQAARALHLGLAARGLPDPVPAADAALDRYAVVRANLTRGTLRAVSAADYRTWRPALQPALERVTRGFLGKALARMPLPEVLAEARELLGAQPLTRAELGRALAGRFPDHTEGDDAGRDLAFAARMLLPVVQEAAAGRWDPDRRPRYLLAEQVLGPLEDEPDAAEQGLASLLRRYLAAFGPATPSDFRYWSGLTGMTAAAARRLVPELTERSVDGTTYLELPGPDAELPAAPEVLLLPPFDDVLFGHADRDRVASKAQLKLLVPPAVEMPGIVLVNGRAGGRWRHRPAKRKQDTDVLEVHLFPEVAAPRTALERATGSLAALLAVDAAPPRVDVATWPG